MQRRAHESTSGVPVQWPVSVVQKPLGLRQSEKIPSKNFWVQRLEMAKQMKNIRQQRADERDKAAQIFTWCMVVAMHQEEGIGEPHAWSGPVMRCTSFSSGIGQKS